MPVAVQVKMNVELQRKETNARVNLAGRFVPIGTPTSATAPLLRSDLFARLYAWGLRGPYKDF